MATTVDQAYDNPERAARQLGNTREVAKTHYIDMPETAVDHRAVLEAWARGPGTKREIYVRTLKSRHHSGNEKPLRPRSEGVFMVGLTGCKPATTCHYFAFIGTIAKWVDIDQSGEPPDDTVACASPNCGRAARNSTAGHRR
ncbi:hypothetical protein [Nocardia noduli]|uniref:hypothetical protein n=1 Tax=Nocardia noduli TaxID=2815722 RepID=UPI001C217400|nr:hypothetical protein [Nocardia noduli]